MVSFFSLVFEVNSHDDAYFCAIFLPYSTRLQEQLLKKLHAPEYTTKVPPKVQEENSAKAAKYENELESIEEAIANFERLKIDSN